MLWMVHNATTTGRGYQACLPIASFAPGDGHAGALGFMASNMYYRNAIFAHASEDRVDRAISTIPR